ncbi:MAG TPA: 5'-methylthioadenosine/S-adenosylhomocysteine nucleosidase [Candidatus Didemnitutus sp.]|nr:5'-methylthioadenosine/S-adenosylhomocysteine nucleosidase [Candidatus Didemnitutus sp.]
MRNRVLVTIAFIAISLGLRAEAVDVLLAAATDAELAPLVGQLAESHTESHVAWTFWTGKISGRKVALVRTEGDPLNAVAAVTLAIMRYQPKLVLTLGAARAHDPALHAGDIVVSEKFAAFDGMISPQKKIGEGSDATTWHPLPHPMMTSGEKETEMMMFPADAGALAVARQLPVARGRLVVGVLGSANQVNREADRIALLRRQWGTSCEDGESAHIAGCAFLLGAPVLGLRVIEGRDGEAAALAQKFLDASK